MTHNLASTIFRKEILNMSAYKVAEAKNLIKLDAMEKPYLWPENLKEEWLNILNACPINRYPDPGAKELTSIIKKTNKIPEQCEILLGNGSDEIIQLLMMALPSDAQVLAPNPSFVMYQQIALSLGLKYQTVSLLADNFELDLTGFLSVIEKHQPSLIFLAYPNNPTGNLFKESDIEKIINVSKGLVIIDEAYAPFANASFIHKLTEYNNLLVMRTVSKLGLAGLRLGYITGKKEIIEQLNKIRLPYNINSLTQLTAEFALKNQSLFKQQTKQICKDRTIVFKQLKEISGISAFNSSANFILFKSGKNQANKTFEDLKKQGILIKNLSPQSGLLTDCLRVTIGKPEENKGFIDALSKIVNSLSK